MCKNLYIVSKKVMNNRIACTDMSNSYITLGPERNFIFKHVIGVSFLREFEVYTLPRG